MLVHELRHASPGLVRIVYKKMKLRALFALVASANAIKFGTYECNNNCANNEKYGKVIGTAQATGMSNVGVFGAYHGNLY